MATVERFEDLQAWQLARVVTRKVYAFSRDGAFSRDFGLRDQMRRAAVSILSNIAEGYERDSDAEFGKFLAIAKGSAGEVRAQLYIARDRNYIGETDFSTAKEAAASLGRRIARFIAYLKRSSLSIPSPKQTAKNRTIPPSLPTPPPPPPVSADIWDF